MYFDSRRKRSNLVKPTCGMHLICIASEESIYGLVAVENYEYSPHQNAVCLLDVLHSAGNVSIVTFFK